MPFMGLNRTYGQRGAPSAIVGSNSGEAIGNNVLYWPPPYSPFRVVVLANEVMGDLEVCA